MFSPFSRVLLYSQENLNYYDLNGNNSDPYTLKGIDPEEREVNKKIITFALNMSPEDRHRKFVYTVRKKIKKTNDERIISEPNTLRISLIVL